MDLAGLGKAMEAWGVFQAKRREAVRTAVRTLLATAHSESRAGHRTPDDEAVDRHLDEILEASLPLKDLSADVLRFAVDYLGKK